MSTTNVGQSKKSDSGTWFWVSRDQLGSAESLRVFDQLARNQGRVGKTILLPEGLANLLFDL
jgi:hypothetical protein